VRVDGLENVEHAPLVKSERIVTLALCVVLAAPGVVTGNPESLRLRVRAYDHALNLGL